MSPDTPQEPLPEPQSLADEELALVPLAPGDTESIACAIARDPEASAWWGADARKIAGWLSEDGVAPYLIVVNGETAGMVEFSEENDPDYRYASIDITLLAPYVNRGIGPRSLRALLRYLFEVRGHHRVTIDPMVHNVRAIRAYEKAGFRRVGVMRQAERDPDGVWRDNLLMEILAEEFE